MVRRVDPSTAEWMVDLIKNGRESFADIGEENPLGMLGMLSERAVMDRVAALLYQDRMIVVNEMPSTGITALAAEPFMPRISLYGAIRWAEMNGYVRCSENDDHKHIAILDRVAIGECYINSHSYKIGTIGWDGYRRCDVFGKESIGIRQSWLSDHQAFEAEFTLLVRRSPLSFVGATVGDKGYEFTVTGDHPLTKADVESYLRLREMEFRDVISADEDHARTSFAPGEPVIATRSKKTHCRACYGRGSKQPVTSGGKPPRETCEACHGSGRVSRKGK